jgi:hypothetical protein
MCSGSVSPAPGAPLTDTKLLGTAKITIDGFVTAEAGMSVGGTIARQEATGQAIVNSDCTGTIRYTQTLNGNPAPDLNIRFLVFDSGSVMWGLSVDSGTVLSCRLVRMRL